MALNHLLAGVGNAVHAQHTLFRKDKLRRQVRPLQLDLGQFSPRDFREVPRCLTPFEPLLAGTTPFAGNLRLRRFDDALLFSGEFEYPIPFDEFVERVHIEHAIQYMNDYMGGSLTVVDADPEGRPLVQAERNLYLQQPNWMVLLGGDVIDVEKLEVIRRSENRQSIFWKTVSSPNGSAVHDDGRVSFLRARNDCTRVEIVTRQKFTLPLFFQATHIDLFPFIRDPIIEQGYQNFFTRTIANMQAQFEGSPYRTGYDAAAGEQERLSDLARNVATALATLGELLRHKGDRTGVADWFAARSWQVTPPPTASLDKDGFRHFGPTPAGTRYDRSAVDMGDYYRQFEELVLESPGMLAGLAEAVQRDVETFARENEIGGNE